MRVLLDENVPRKLKFRFPSEHDAVTVGDSGWAGLLNGELLRAADRKFDAFVTLDQGLEYQQDLQELSLRIVLVHATSSQYEDILPLLPEILEALAHVNQGTVVHVGD